MINTYKNTKDSLWNILKRSFFLGLFLFTVFSTECTASAATDITGSTDRLTLTCYANPPVNLTVIADNAYMLTDEETEQIRTYCDSIFNEYNISIYIVTSNKIGSEDDYTGYMKQISEQDGAPKNMALLFISNKKNAQLCRVASYGTAKKYLTANRCDTLAKYVQRNVSAKKYYSALETFCMKTRSYLGENPRFDLFIFQPLPQLFFSLLLSVLIIFFMAKNISKKTTIPMPAYIDPEQAQLLEEQDTFTHTTTSPVPPKKPHALNSLFSHKKSDSE